MSTTVRHPLNTPNFTEVIMTDTHLWFSYETLIAFQTFQSGLVVRENEWSTTTGKHLNYLTDKKNRVPRERFLELAEKYEIGL